MIKDYFTNLAKAFNPIPYFRASMTITESLGTLGQKAQPFRYQHAVDQFLSWIYIAANLNAKAVAAVPLRLYVRGRHPGGLTKLWRTTGDISRTRLQYLKGESGDPRLQPSAIVRQKIIEYGVENVEEVTEPHPALELLRTINPYANGFDSTILRMLYLQVTGNAYMHPIMSRELGRPSALWTMPAQWVWVKTSRETFIDGYVYGRFATDQAEFKPDEVIHWKLPNLNDLHYGRGFVEAIWSALNLHREKRETDLGFYENRARPDWLMIVRRGSSQAQIERFEKNIDKKLKGSRLTGRFMAISGDVQAQQLNFPEAVIGDPERVIEEIAGAFGVPITKILANDPNRANAETGDAGWFRDTILPLCRLDEQTLNEQLLPLFGIGDDAFLAYDNPVPRDNKFDLERNTRNVITGIRTIDEVRAEDGLEPLEDGLGAIARVNGIPLDEIGQQPGFGFGAGSPSSAMSTEQASSNSGPIPARIAIPATAGPTDETGDAANQNVEDETAENLVGGAKLNGAQIASAIETLKELGAGRMASEAANELLVALGIDEQRVARMITATVTLAENNPDAFADPEPAQGSAGKPEQATGDSDMSKILAAMLKAEIRKAAGMNVAVPSDGGFIVDPDKNKSPDDLERGIVMAPIPGGDVDSKIWEIIDGIHHDDFNDDEGGIEISSHVTVKYGFTGDNLEDILPALRGIGPIDATLGRVNRFENEKADVLYVEIDSKGLDDLHEALGGLPNDDEYDQYVPHLTIAYLKPGKAEPLIHDDRFEGMRVAFNSLDVRSRTGEQVRVQLSDKDDGQSGDKSVRLSDETYDACIARMVPDLMGKGMAEDDAKARAAKQCGAKAGDNCGTGDGGFQTGNDCAGDEGSGGGDDSDGSGPTSSDLADMVRNDGGFTYDPRAGDLETSGYVVSFAKENQQIHKLEDLTIDKVEAYVDKHLDLWDDPKAHFGGWLKEETQEVFFDTVLVLESQSEADKIAREIGEDAYYDLTNGQQIDIKSKGRGRQALTSGANQHQRARRGNARAKSPPDITADHGLSGQVSASDHHCSDEGEGGPMPVNFKSWKRTAVRPSADPDTDPSGNLGDADDDRREGEPKNPIEQFAADMAEALAMVQSLIAQRIAAVKGKSRPGRARSRIVKITRSQIDAIIDGAVDEMRDTIAQRTSAAISDIIGTGGAEGLARLGLSSPFDVTNPAVADFVSTFTVRLADEASTTTINALRPQLVEVAEAGMSNSAIAELLEQDQSGLFSAERANVIARTESARAFVEGERESWKQSGVVDGVKWLLAPNACQFCRSIAKQFENKTVGLGETFLPQGTILRGLDGGTMKLNYSPITGPPLHPNCRCDLNPVVSKQ